MMTLSKRALLRYLTTVTTAYAFAGILLLLVLSGCASRMTGAPVSDASRTSRHTTVGTVVQAPVLSPAPPGYYRVQPGDTLYQIALRHGQSYHDIARWNILQDPSQIEVGQLLRIASPTAGATTATPIGGNAVHVRPLDGAPPTTGAAPPAVTTIPPDQLSRPAPPGSLNTGLKLIWPVSGPVLTTFSETKNKGINIGGTLGTPIVAAFRGRVVYAGNMRGYGKLIVLIHEAGYITAYAHNRTLLVKEADIVKKGQEIAEMGQGDAQRVMLYFEFRKEGKPLDPLKYLPPQ
jgi:lipoprotein NlpD